MVFAARSTGPRLSVVPAVRPGTAAFVGAGTREGEWDGGAVRW